MKKIAFVILTIVLVFSLTSCKVNWFDQQYDVPWWAIAIPVFVFSAIVLFVAGKHIASKKYVCPKCNKSFYPKWWQAALSIHMNDDRVFKCPHCGRKGFCPIVCAVGGEHPRAMLAPTPDAERREDRNTT